MFATLRSAWNKTCNFVAEKVDDVKGAALGVVGTVAGVLGLSAAPQDAHAALPAGVDTALATVQTDAAALLAIVFPVMIAILGMVIVIKLTKRFVNKL